MAMRHHPTIPESSSSNNGEVSDSALMEASPLESGLNNANRTSRSVDIFSLGCIFYCTILPGSHPFGEYLNCQGKLMPVVWKAFILLKLPYNNPSIQVSGMSARPIL